MRNWGNLKSPRDILQNLRNPNGELSALYSDSFLEDSRREVIYNAIIEFLTQIETRHLERARLAYSILKKEYVDENKLRELGIYGLERETYLRVIASNFYAALTHITEVLLELRNAPENAVTGTLELLVSGQEQRKKESLQSVLEKIDNMAKKVFEYEQEIFESELGVAISFLYCLGEREFKFQLPVSEINIHNHWGQESNFYAHHEGQWNEVRIAREQYESAARKLGIDLTQYKGLQKLYERFEQSFENNS